MLDSITFTLSSTYLAPNLRIPMSDLRCSLRPTASYAEFRATTAHFANCNASPWRFDAVVTCILVVFVKSICTLKLFESFKNKTSALTATKKGDDIVRTWTALWSLHESRFLFHIEEKSVFLWRVRNILLEAIRCQPPVIVFCCSNDTARYLRRMLRKVLMQKILLYWLFTAKKLSSITVLKVDPTLSCH